MIELSTTIDLKNYKMGELLIKVKVEQRIKMVHITGIFPGKLELN